MKHVAIKIRKKYIFVFDGNYKQLVYLISGSVFDTVQRVLVGTVPASIRTPCVLRRYTAHGVDKEIYGEASWGTVIPRPVCRMKNTRVK
jgi:hypothetical protein